MKSCNERSAEIARRLVEEADELGVRAHRLGNGAVWIDCGRDAEGSLEAGRLYALACMGGMAEIGFGMFDLDGVSWPSVVTSISRPLLACMGCQYAGWRIKAGGEGVKFRAMGSGPARMLGSGEELLDRFDLRERADEAVIALETAEPPNEAAAEVIAAACGISPKGLYILAAPTSSLAGSVQIAARTVETGIHKMIETSFPTERILSAAGSCPLPPVCSDETEAMGRTNDAVLYGGSAWYALRSGEDLSEPAAKLASSSSPDFGVSFAELFRRCEGDFYKMDPMLFSPAEVVLNDLESGRSYRAGGIRGDILRREWLGA